MSEVFGSVYADAYDLFYRDKDYAAESDLIECIFQTYGDGAIRSILDLVGCGTGNHAIPLAQRGYEVVGIDRSENMLDQARREATGQSHIHNLRTAPRRNIYQPEGNAKKPLLLDARDGGLVIVLRFYTA